MPTAKRTRIKRSKQKFVKVPVRLALVSLTGFLILFVSAWYVLYQETVLSFKAAPIVVANAELRGEAPARIEISRLSVNLEILPTSIIDGIWQVPDNAAAYLESSARPKEDGNIVVYAHNKKNLFGPLKQAKVGDTIDLVSADGKKFTYTVDEIRVVSPDAVAAVLPTDHEVLTIYTCTGLFDSQRLVIRALPSQLASL